MSISKTISTLSLALAMVGGVLVFNPSKAEAAGAKSNSTMKQGGGSPSVRLPGPKPPPPIRKIIRPKRPCKTRVCLH